MFKHAEVKRGQGSKKSMFKQHGDGTIDQDTNSLEFGPALVPPGTSVQGDNSLTLWGPGVQAQETPSSILSQSLYKWRNDNAQLSPAKAAEELDKLYENLPPEALELTFEDMIGRNNSPKLKEENVSLKKMWETESNRIKEEEVEDDAGQDKQASKEKKENGPKLSMAAKIATLISPKTVYSPSDKVQLSHADLDKLVEKKRRKSRSSDREGLYSASTTPATSFRRVSPFTSPKLSPTASFNALQIDRLSLERETARSARYLEVYVDDTGGMPSVDEKSSQQSIVPTKSHNSSHTTRVKHGNDCSTCSTTNLFFLKTTCMECGKSFCPTCKNLQTKEVRGVRTCKDNCGVDKTAEDRFIDDTEKGRMMPSGCCSIGLRSFMGVKRVSKA